MATPQQIRSTVHSYIDMMCRSDIDGIMALYADDATAEDPVGGTPVRGGTAQYLDATDILCFNEEGKITSMRAYWSPAELRVERHAS